MAPTKADRAKQRAISKEWRTFRSKHLFSQIQLAEALGISRRAVQYVESGKGKDPDSLGIPHASTLQKFKILKKKFESEAK